MIKKWNETLEKIFETNTHDLSLLENQQIFELNSDNSFLENLSYIHSYIHSQRLEKNNIHSVFTQLSPYFEIGFLFEKENRLSLAIDGFAFGQPIDLANKILQLQLPKSSLFHIVKTEAGGVLTKLNYNFLNSKNNMNAFVIAVSPTYSMLFATGLAEPWLKMRLEVLQKTLMKIHFE